jgi:hypothetical protein
MLRMNWLSSRELASRPGVARSTLALQFPSVDGFDPFSIAYVEYRLYSR